ncbi:MAG: hypothetical protein Alpg2KO_17970 [Alphaproteobacteria bacterium]
MPKNENPWDAFTGDPMTRMISLTCHEHEGKARQGKRVFVTLDNCIMEEMDGYTKLVIKRPKGYYYCVVETPEEIFAKAGMPVPDPGAKPEKADASQQVEREVTPPR